MPRTLCAVALALLLARGADAQVDPSARWRTLRTAHARVHFAAGNEELARRTAANVERAWAQLAAVLRPPRGPLDVVLSDDVDFSNGSATPIPTNRIIIYAAPPVEPGTLRFTNDWNQLVVTHELTHVFHLDRARGVWALGQSIFGRAPFLFPNAFGPSWLTEGLAVWFESELTGAGRLRGTEHRALAHAAAVAHRVPRLDELSIATPRFPGGDAAYAYGSLFIEYLARERGARAIRAFIDAQSAMVIPIWLDPPARRAFGDPLLRAWQRYTDSLVASAGADRPPLDGWRVLARGELVASPPRWKGDTLLTTSTPGRHPLALESITTAGESDRGARRWSISPQVPLRDGGVLYSQIDYRDLYHLRSDLWIEHGGSRRRITTGARLIAPDARADGEIVAVQGLPGGTRLVRVSADGARITPITSGGPDTNWSEPRWSPDGTRIAAVRWTRGAFTEVVVLDTLGRNARVLASGRSVHASPAWSPDSRRVLYTSDAGGIAAAYVADASGDSITQRISGSATGVAFPQLSADGRTIALVQLRADGWELGVAPMSSSPIANLTRLPLAPVNPAPRDTIARVQRYSPWRTLVPRWWMPLAEAGLGEGTRLGAFTAGNDVVGRHAYSAELLVPTDNSGTVGFLGYRFAGLGQPLLDASVSQDWSFRGTIVDTARNPLGDLRRRIRDAQLSATFIKPRVRQTASITIGAGLEERHFVTEPVEVIDQLVPRPSNIVRPRVFVGAGWSRVERAPWSISPEDGVTLSGTALHRWRRGFAGTSSNTAIGIAAGYKSLDLPGFARHVLTAHLAGGVTDRNTTSALEVGGTSGSVLQVAPGVSVGEGRETFGVRGFHANAISGIRAAAGTLEYRAPLAMRARGLRLLPLFLDRTALALFADAGSAWCPAEQARLGLCRWTGGETLPPSTQLAPDRWRTISSVGAELHINAAVLSWDQPYRFRFGVAFPMQGREFTGADKVEGLFAVGLAF